MQRLEKAAARGRTESGSNYGGGGWRSRNNSDDDAAGGAGPGLATASALGYTPNVSSGSYAPTSLAVQQQVSELQALKAQYHSLTGVAYEQVLYISC